MRVSITASVCVVSKVVQRCLTVLCLVLTVAWRLGNKWTVSTRPALVPECLTKQHNRVQQHCQVYLSVPPLQEQNQAEKQGDQVCEVMWERCGPLRSLGEGCTSFLACFVTLSFSDPVLTANTWCPHDLLLFSYFIVLSVSDDLTFGLYCNVFLLPPPCHLVSLC